MNDEQINYMRLMYESGVTNQTIANIMSNALNKNGTPGEFLASTIKNINEKNQEAMDEIAGIDADWSVAQKTIGRLNE